MSFLLRSSDSARERASGLVALNLASRADHMECALSMGISAIKDIWTLMTCVRAWEFFSFQSWRVALSSAGRGLVPFTISIYSLCVEKNKLKFLPGIKVITVVVKLVFIAELRDVVQVACWRSCCCVVCHSVWSRLRWHATRMKDVFGENLEHEAHNL